MAGGKEAAGQMQAAAAVPGKKLHLVVTPAIRRYVGMAIAIEVGDRDTVRVREGMHIERGVRRRRESAFTVAQEDGDGGRLVVGNDQVGMAVAVHVGDGKVVRL